MAVAVSAFAQHVPQAQPLQAQAPQAQQQQPIGRPASSTERYNVSGDRIVDYFDVHAAELRSVLRQLSAYSGRDIVSNDAVKATVTLSVTHKSWREILAIVCMVHGLAFVEEPSFIYVMSREQAATYSASVGKIGEGGGMPIGMDLGGPLVREIIPMRFTTASETGAAITPFLSQRGKLTPITHTNSIVIVDTDDNLRQLKNLVAQIDIQTPQVSISCKIIQTSTDAIQNVGVNWGFVDTKNKFTVGMTGSKDDGGGGNTGGPYLLNTPDGKLTATPGGVTYGLLSPEKFGVALDYLFRDTKTEIVAQPQITTLNNKEANISIGEQRAISSATAEGTGITQMVSVSTQLTVTPYVSGEGKIMLSLSASKEDFGPTVDGNVTMLQKNAKTNVLVNNGETVVIAGLTSNNKTNSSSGIPFLKDIPILGYLFKRSEKSNNKTDLIIFVTPHIIHSEIGPSSGK